MKGIDLDSGANNNLIYHNNLINNSRNAEDDGYKNLWHNGYPSGGNYWSDHECEGNPSNGSQPYYIPGSANAIDWFPFQDQDGWLIENQPPVASFTYSPENPIINETITFNASSSYDPDGYITNYEWNFGDGNITNTAEPTIAHSYTSAGVYNINLTVTDNDGATNSTSKLIKVSELEELIFDTGAPLNPYPSIAGTHNGTIKPNHTIIATKLYTYPCTGTGGHTEYARIWNKTWNATATWEGYESDWHNITFDKTVVLLAGETYNYTIRTGSYPQIIHGKEFNATGGEITCTEFIDANGKIYYDWIPAIRLWMG